MPPAQAESMRGRPRRRGNPLRPAFLRGRGPRLPPGRHADRLSGGRAGVLPRRSSASRIALRVPLATACPCVRGFRDTHADHFFDDDPDMVQRPDRRVPPCLRAGEGRSPRSPATRCCTGPARCSPWSPSTRRPTRCTRSGAAWPCCRSSSARWPRPCSPGSCSGARRRQPAGGLTPRQHHRAWVARDRRRRAASSPARWPSRSASRSCGASTASPGRTSSPRSSRSRSAARTSCGARTPTTRSCGCPTPCTYHAPGEPDYAGFLPYLPLMAVAGHPERHLAQQRPQRRPHLLLPHHPGRGRPRALPLPGRRASQDPRAAGAGHPAAGVAAPRHRGRRHPGRRLPPPRGGAGAAATTLRVGVVFGIASAMKFTAWPLAVLGALRRTWPQRGAPADLDARRHARRGRPDHLPLRACAARSR